MTSFDPVKKLTDSLFRSFLLQGLFFIVLGIIMLMYPKTLVYLVVILSILVGIAAIVTGGKIKSIGKEISEI